MTFQRQWFKREFASVSGEQDLKFSVSGKNTWLSGMDLNHDKGLQRALCYHYTTGQTRAKLAFQCLRRKEIFESWNFSSYFVLFRNTLF